MAPAKKESVADSWEDDDLSDNGDVEGESQASSRDIKSAPSHQSNSSAQKAPVNEQAEFDNPFGYRPGEAADRARKPSHARPEKTDAVAKRLIAGALGIKAPKKTEEQRAYDRAIREKEIKRINQEKAAAAEANAAAEAAKVAIWED